MERFSFEVGRRLEKDPPQNTDVRYFKPSTVYNYMDLSGHNQRKADSRGHAEQRKFVKRLYEKLPFVIDLHDTPPYASSAGGAFLGSTKYILFHPHVNSKLSHVVEKFVNTHPVHKIMIGPAPRSVLAFYRELTVESFPSKLTKNGDFETMTVEEEVGFVRELVEFFKKNYSSGT